MKTSRHFIGICAAWFAALTIVTADVPTMISYQGRVKTTNSIPFNGTGYFQFALVDAGAANTYWSNDGMIGAGAVPTAIVHIPVSNGVYSVYLGNRALAGMTNIPTWIFTNNPVYLRVWFSDGSVSPQLTAPDTRIASVGYAMIAETVVDGGITKAKLADNAVTSDKLAEGSITSRELAEEISLGVGGVSAGLLEVHPAGLVDPAIILDGSAGTVTVPEAFIVGGTITRCVLKDESQRGVLKLNNLDQQEAVWLGATTSGAGELKVNQPDAEDGVTKGVTVVGDQGDDGGGAVLVYNRDGDLRVSIDGDSDFAGLITVKNSLGSTSVTVDGDSTGNAGGIAIYQSDGSTVGVNLKADADNGGGGLIVVKQNDDDIGVYIDGNDENGAGFISVRNTAGDASIYLYGAKSTGDGGEIRLFNGSGVNTLKIDGADSDDGGWIGLWDANRTGPDDDPKIKLDANASGGARITTCVLEITGGCDLSENFDIIPLNRADSPKPGMIVCIDSDNPGQLMVSSKAYDRTVAGVMSGAGGVKPGMLMGQHGSPINGKHPVALTGRVYCQADASNGPIQPGDLLTTSDRPGHAMKVTDHTRAQGAIIGKAMSRLDTGAGLVLVLVSLQ